MFDNSSQDTALKTKFNNNNNNNNNNIDLIKINYTNLNTTTSIFSSVYCDNLTCENINNIM